MINALLFFFVRIFIITMINGIVTIIRLIEMRTTRIIRSLLLNFISQIFSNFIFLLYQNIVESPQFNDVLYLVAFTDKSHLCSILFPIFKYH